MTYIEGFVAAVPKANKDKYRKHAEKAAPIFKEFGVARMVENWGDGIPEGVLNDLRGAVKAKEDEDIIFSWFEYPSKEVRDAANEKIRNDLRMKEMGAKMPFDGMRMIFGGFSTMYDANSGDKATYVDGILCPVSQSKKDEFLKFGKSCAKIFLAHGATRVTDAWGDDIPEGKVTDFQRAVIAKDNENVVFGWVEWPSKTIRDKGWKTSMADERMKKLEFPYDGSRMIFGGFEVMLDET